MAFKTAVKIWFVAVLLSSICFAIYLAIDENPFEDDPEEFLRDILVLNFMLTIPWFLLLWLVIGVCVKTSIQGMKLLLVVLIYAVAIAVLVYYATSYMFDWDNNYPMFLYFPVISAVVAVILLHKSLLDLSSLSKQ